MHIECTNGNPIVDTLDHLPPLPLLVNYRYIKTERDELGIYHALRLRNRLRHIHLYLPPSILHKCLMLMDGPFPRLEHLSLSFADDKITTLTLPKAFLAPNLRHLSLPGIGPPKRLRLLTSTVSLVILVLRNIQTSSYFRPKLLVARLSSLPQLEQLSIHFSAPIPRPSTERELLGEQGTPLTLPNLKTFRFQGVGVYLESLVAQIRAPLLERLDIALFNQIAFALPHLSHLINITEGLIPPTMMLSFRRNEVTIFGVHHSFTSSDERFLLRVMCKQADWQIDSAAQICGALIPALSSIERFALDTGADILPTEWKNAEIDSTTLNELLRPFIGVKELHINSWLLGELFRALQGDEGSDPGFLPDLQNIVASSNRFSSFIDARRVVGRPVQFSERTSRSR